MRQELEISRSALTEYLEKLWLNLKIRFKRKVSQLEKTLSNKFLKLDKSKTFQRAQLKILQSKMKTQGSKVIPKIVLVEKSK
jgi:hypothetical protein